MARAPSVDTVPIALLRCPPQMDETRPNDDAGSNGETPPPRTAMRFFLTALGIGIGLTGLFRVPWIQHQLLIPYAVGQQKVAGWVIGLRDLPVVVNFSCTGADVMALCIAAIAAFPAPLRARLRGIGIGLLLISAINTVRIGSLSLVVRQTGLFNALHLLIWPAILIVFVTLYVFWWMRSVRGGRGADGGPGGGPTGFGWGDPVTRRFAGWLAGLSVIYAIWSGWHLDSAWVLALARWVALCGAVVLSLLGASATVSGKVLTTSYGSYVVTATCIATPLIPVYFAAALALPASRRKRMAALAAGPFVIFALGVARLLVLALPATVVPSHATAIHAFNQLLFAVVLVVLAALWQGRSAGEGAGRIARRAVAAVALGCVTGAAAGLVWTRPVRLAAEALAGLFGHGGHGFADTQGATSMTPAFQVGFLVALLAALSREVTWRPGRLAAAAGLLVLSQVALFVLLAELWAHAGWEPHVSLVRAWAVLAPAILAWGLAGRFRGLAWFGRTPADRVAQEG